MASENVFTGSCRSPECDEFLIKCLRNVERKINAMIVLSKTKQESQIKVELHMIKLNKNSLTLLARKTIRERQKAKSRKKDFRR